MPMLDRDGEVGAGWAVIAAEAAVPADGPVLLELARFQAAGGRNAPTGVIIDAGTPHDALPELAARAAAIAIRFPGFRDGRGFTLVRRLRERLFYGGPILAAGHVLPDQWHHLRQLGASAVLLADGTDLAPWQRAASRFARPYQSALTGGPW
jgi:uncharacterized protein (DUF934 family)